MDEKCRFVLQAKEKKESLTCLCREYGISRKTGYKWIHRYQLQGLDGLKEKSRRPHKSPIKTCSEVEQFVIFERLKHSSWGPKKLRARLIRNGYEGNVPSASTIGTILKRHGLVKNKKRKPSYGVRRGELTEPICSNHVWAVDFKGWFLTRDGIRCDPLTITDLHSRYILQCRALSSQKLVDVKPIFEKAFRRYGLPKIIRSDNGTPFSSSGLLGLSQLSAWWILLGISPELIEPGHPEQNSKHERMHRTLKAEATKPPALNMRSQQKKFDRFTKEFNYERPHEALNMKCPADLYEKSPRKYEEDYKEFSYPSDYITRRVRCRGNIKWKGVSRHISNALSGVTIGIKQVEEKIYEVYFGKLKLGILNEKDKGSISKFKYRVKK